MRHSYYMHSNIRAPHSVVFIFQGAVISFFFTHKAFEIAVINEIILTKRTPHQYESIARSGSGNCSCRLGS
jgi:hypothetical protein